MGAEDQRRERPRVALLAAVLAIAAALVLGAMANLMFSTSHDPTDRPVRPEAIGAPTPEAIAPRYVEALNRSDPEALRVLAAGLDEHVEQLIAQRLRVWGGQAITLSEISAEPGFASYQSTLRLRGSTGAGATYAETLILTNRGDQWLIVMNDDSPGVPLSPPAPPGGSRENSPTS